MTQEEKELLLKDLSARLPYGVILLSQNGKVTYQTDGNTAAELLVEEGWKPYLRPMSSMTEEERNEFENLFPRYSISEDRGSVYHSCRGDLNLDIIDWLNEKEFDYRGLIEKGLALEAPEGMYDLKD